MINTIIVCILIMLIISAGSLVGALIFNKNYEQCLPVWLMFLVLILYLFGIVGILKAGFWFILLLCVGIYIWAPINIYIYKSKHVWKRFFCPGFFRFFICVVGLIYINFDMKVYLWDEFSHWGTVVKQMFLIDALSTSPQAVSVVFKSYPPAMALFQYLITKMSVLIAPEFGFNEWLLYFSYNIFLVSFIAYFWTKLSFRRINSYIYICIALLAPLYFFPELYASLYIDPFVSFTAAAGLAAIMLPGKRDLVDKLFSLFAISTLVLSKDVGMLFALVIAFAYAGTQSKLIQDGKLRISKKNLTEALVPFLFLGIPKLLWEYSLTQNRVIKSFSDKIDFRSLINVLTGKEDSYRAEVVSNYFEYLISEKQLIVFAVLCIFLLVLFARYKKEYPTEKRKSKYICSLVAVQGVLYIVGMCVIYMYKFSEYEALFLASVDRYLGICFVAFFFFLLFTVMGINAEMNLLNKLFPGLLLIIVLLIIPRWRVENHLTRATVERSHNVTYWFNDICAEIDNYTPDNSIIYLVDQEDSGFTKWVYHYNLMPRMILSRSAERVPSWSIGKPFYEGDVWTEEKTAEQWQEELKEHYDYVVLYGLNDYFYEEYSSVFSSFEDIYPSGIYRVDKETGLLYLCNQNDVRERWE